MNSKQIVVDGLLTRYATAGEGRVILMLHGWGDSLSTFHELALRLAESFQVICLDLPGFGQTETPANAWGVHEYASFVQQFIEKVEISEVYALVGHSHGGAIAVQAVAEMQVPVQKLILLASAGVRNKNQLKKSVLKAGAKTAKVLTVALPKVTRQKLRNRLYGVIGSDMTVVPHMEESFRRVVAEDVTAYAAKIQVPTVLIYGNKDEATPQEDGRLYESLISDSRLYVLDAGHFVHHDQPKRVQNIIEEFLS